METKRKPPVKEMHAILTGVTKYGFTGMVVSQGELKNTEMQFLFSFKTCNLTEEEKQKNLLKISTMEKKTILIVDAAYIDKDKKTVYINSILGSIKPKASFEATHQEKTESAPEAEAKEKESAPAAFLAKTDKSKNDYWEKKLEFDIEDKQRISRASSMAHAINILEMSLANSSEWDRNYSSHEILEMAVEIAKKIEIGIYQGFDKITFSSDSDVSKEKEEKQESEPIKPKEENATDEDENCYCCPGI